MELQCQASEVRSRQWPGQDGAPSRRDGAGPSDRLRLLIVDDYPDVADSFARMLKLWGHEVYVCRDGQEALDAAAACRPDVALVDIRLPRMDGFELARRLRGRPDLIGMTLVAVTGLGDQATLRSSQEAGFVHHLLKPVEPAELRAILAAVLETKDPSPR